MQPLRRINSLVLPVSYPDNFYNRLLTPGESQPIFSRIILWQDRPSKGSSQDAEIKVIGGIICRIDANEDAPKTSSIYIQSLALLSPYRSYGLATRVLDDIIAHATSNAFDDGAITSLYAHVWTQNEEALEWYAKRGFTREDPILHGYYRRLKPDTAWLVRRPLQPSDHLRNAVTSPVPAEQTPPTPPTTSTPPPLPLLPPHRPNSTSTHRTTSYQSQRPATEWNDLPSDLLNPSRSASNSTTPSQRPSPSASLSNLLEPPSSAAAPPANSDKTAGPPQLQPRNTSAREKKKRQYPAAAFGA